MTYNYFNELKRSFEKRAFVYSDGYDDGGRSDRALEAASSGVGDALAAATGATADVGRIADTVEDTGGAVQKTLGEITPAATGALGALKWAPAALAGIPTAGYLLHQYLKGSYDDKKKKKEEKEASYLGRRAMEKSGQRAVSKWLKNVGEQGGKWLGPSAAPYARGNILPAVAAGGAGYAGYEAGGDSLTVGGLTGLGTLGLMNPRVLRAFQENALSRARKKGDWPKGTTPQQAYDTGLTDLTPQQHRNSMWTNEFLKGLGLKGALVTGGVAFEHGPGMIQDAKGFTNSMKGTASNLEKQTAAPTMYTVSNGKGYEQEQPESYVNRLVAEITGGNKADPIAEGEDVAYDKFANTWRSFFEKEIPKPPAERKLSFKKKPGITRAISDAASEVQDVTRSTAEFTEEVLPQLKNVLDPLPGAAEDVSAGMRSQAEEAGKWREGVGTAINKAAPVGAGALGGYILSSLLGPGVKQDETPSERERRERLQRIYNLVATTGGGALGYYLSNRFGGGDEKAASDLGRAAAQQFSY